jgi:hypothetical protein
MDWRCVWLTWQSTCFALWRPDFKPSPTKKKTKHTKKSVALMDKQSQKSCCWWQKRWLLGRVLHPCCAIPSLSGELNRVWELARQFPYHTKCRKHLTCPQSSLWSYLTCARSLQFEVRKMNYLYVGGDTERICYSVTDGNRFTKTLIVSRQVFKHTWEYITDTLQEYTGTLLFP